MNREKCSVELQIFSQSPNWRPTMPTIPNGKKEVYQLFYAAAKEYFEEIGDPPTRLLEGEVLYRYVGYRDGLPQVADAGRQVFLKLADDKKNRWTGLGPDGTGQQGLYLLAEYINETHPFPELEHYQKKDKYELNAQVDCLNYKIGKRAAGVPAGASDAAQTARGT